MKLHTSSLVKLILDNVGEPKSGVEVGVFRGQNSASLLKTFKGLLLVMVDPWQSWDEDSSYFQGDYDMGRIDAAGWKKIEQEALMRVEPYKNRTILYQTTSKEACKMAPSGFDFVFLDANHTYEAVKDDIQLWLPKIKVGGLLCGHDYGGGHRGVKKAVDEIFGDKVIVKCGRIWGVPVAHDANTLAHTVQTNQ